MSANVTYPDGAPRALTVSDDCGAALTQPDTTGSLFVAWPLPSTTRTCKFTIHATSLAGGVTDTAVTATVTVP